MAYEDNMLEGKVALVTGANRQGAIGASIAYVLASAKAHVLISGRNGEELAETAASFKRIGLSVEAEAGDLLDEGDIKRVAEAAIDRFGSLDVLVNNASEVGLAGDADIADMDAALWDRIFETNARGTMLMAKHAIPHMVKAGGGSIINISSASGSIGHTRYTAYACSKAAVNTLTKYIATQYGSKGIRCNTVIPSLILTQKSLSMPQRMAEAYQDNCLLDRLGQPIDVAKAVRFLASNESGYVTGQELVVDGGFTMHMPVAIHDAEQRS